MKIHNIKYLLIAVFMLVISACDPIVDEQHLSNTTTVEGVELKATNTTPGGNEIKLQMLSPGITGYWDYIIDKALTDTYTVTMPVTGTFDFAYKGTLGAEFFEKTVPVTITVLDHEVRPEWGALLGPNAKEGKTWVFDNQGPDSLWWYMSPDVANGGKEKWDVVWWNAGGTCCPPSDADGKMHFDLNGAPNYNHYETKTATPSKGKFQLDLKNMSLNIIGSKMLGYSAGNADGRYEIIELTENRMVLHLSNNEANKTGWTFIFRPE